MTRIIRSLLTVLPILATSSPMVSAEDFVELIPVPYDPNNPGPPAVLFNEAELVSVQDPQMNRRSPAMLEDRTTSPYHLDKKSDAMIPNPEHPNGRCSMSLYVRHEDDRICERQHPTVDDSRFAARKSVCSLLGGRRTITCQVCYRVMPYVNHWDIHATKKWYIGCEKGQRCRQYRRPNRWGQDKPSSSCVSEYTIKERLIDKGSEITSYCTNKVRAAFPKNKNKKGPDGQLIARSAKFHAWLFDRQEGDLVKAMWLFFVVDDGLIAKIKDIDDWTYYSKITSMSNFQMCVVPKSGTSRWKSPTTRDLELDVQVTVL